MSELLVLLWTARCLESHMLLLKTAQSPLCQLQLLHSLSPRMPDPVQMSQSRGERQLQTDQTALDFM